MFTAADQKLPVLRIIPYRQDYVCVRGGLYRSCFPVLRRAVNSTTPTFHSSLQRLMVRRARPERSSEYRSRRGKGGRGHYSERLLAAGEAIRQILSSGPQGRGLALGPWTASVGAIQTKRHCKKTADCADKHRASILIPFPTLPPPLRSGLSEPGAAGVRVTRRREIVNLLPPAFWYRL